MRLNRAIYLALLPCLALSAVVAVAVYPYLPADAGPRSDFPARLRRNHRHDRRVRAATVSAIGHWSAALGAMVRPPDSPVGLVTVVTGGPEALDGRPDMPPAEPQPVSSAIIAIALAIGAFFLARVILPTVR